MTLYCSECGSIIEDDADFCYTCGALRSTAFVMDENGDLKPAGPEATVNCPDCGFSNKFDSKVCADCGAPLGSITYYTRPHKLDRRDYISIALAAIPGFFGLCGLGHIAYGHYSGAFKFIILSLVILYVEISNGFSTATPGLILVRVLGFILFFRSLTDVFRYAYYPDQVSAEEGK